MLFDSEWKCSTVCDQAVVLVARVPAVVPPALPDLAVDLVVPPRPADAQAVPVDLAN